MHKEINIRCATAVDITDLVNIARTSFHDTFSQFPENSPDDIKKYVDDTYTTEALHAELADKDVAYFVAELDGRLVGYAKLQRFSQENETGGESPIELCRLYNLRDFIGKGIGKSLMLRCLEFAKENDHDMIWLGVWEHNSVAINFYRKFGFEKCGDHVFQFGTEPQTDWLMERRVN